MLKSLLLLGCLAAIALQQLGAASPFQSIFGSSSSTSTSVVRLRANKLRRPEWCRENLPRKSEDLPALVITAKVKEVYLAGEQAAGQPGGPATDSGAGNKALVAVLRVIKGNQQLVSSDIIISGFNSTSSQPCPNYVKPNDTLILLLNQEGERKYSIQGSNLLSMNLNNLERVNAVAADEAFKRRGPIQDILCEAHYCAYGRCAVDERTSQTSCQCPELCPLLSAPVCGSDNATYTNECYLIREGCRRQKPLFVTKETPC